MSKFRDLLPISFRELNHSLSTLALHAFLAQLCRGKPRDIRALQRCLNTLQRPRDPRVLLGIDLKSFSVDAWTRGLA